MAEHTLMLGSESHLVATFTPAYLSDDTSGAPIVAILTNSGVIPRSGPHRMNVHLARQFAAQGIPSVRFDMSGLGDSSRTASTLPVLDQWVADTRAVMDAAQARFGCARFVMVGFCSGAEVAHLVALQDPRLRAILLWDLYAYDTIETRVRTFLYKLRRAGPVGAVRKAIEKGIGLFRSSPQEEGNAAGRAVEVSLVPPREEFALRVQKLVDNQVELLFVYCGGEPEWFNHHGQFKGMFGKYPFHDKVGFNYLQIADHLITTQIAQDAFLAMTRDWMDARVLPAANANR